VRLFPWRPAGGGSRQEIADDPALRAYAAVLTLLHALTAFWFIDGNFSSLLAHDNAAICWPLLPDCERFRVLSAPQLDLVFRLYGLAAVLVAVTFLSKRRTVVALAGLLALTLVKVCLLALDFRLRRNQHYMALAATAVFLFVPRKRQGVGVLIVLFYFWAGTLKLNSEWLSGRGLYRPLWLFSGRGVIAACAYVVVMELGMVWGLLARRKWLFWASLGQVILFHIMSWSVVGYFYPLVMFGILAIFPLTRLWPSEGPPPRRPSPSSVPERMKASLGAVSPSTWGVLLAFSALQLVPHLYPGDTALTGEGRLFALHMFDARVQCEAQATLHMADGRAVSVDLQGQGGRTACDPIVIAGAARNLCRERNAAALSFVDLDVDLRSHRTTDPVAHQVMAVSSFCARSPQYHPFTHNSWIEVR
jgi:hypothetical protein